MDWVIPMTEEEELAHETFYGVECGNSYVQWLGWEESTQQAKDAAVEMWRYAGKMYGRLIDGKGFPSH
jgi:hypothetical protein